MSESHDRDYIEFLIGKISICKAYRPKLGRGSAVSLEEFKAIYGVDPLYSWLGLDNPLLYAAHKAAGGMTSLYRQIGNGLENVFRLLLQHRLGLSREDSSWSYQVREASRNKPRTLTLDGRIEFAHLGLRRERRRVEDWVKAACDLMQVDRGIRDSLRGCVFEVRQGYKSKDSKRQNADIGNASTAYSQAYLPVAVILSQQIDTDVADRYRAERWLLLTGTDADDPLRSTYGFCRSILGYDLARLLKEHSADLKAAVNEVLEALLAPADSPSAATTELIDQANDDDSTD